MAIFSKHPIIDKGYIDFSETSNGAMFVDLEISDEVVRIYNLHLESFHVPIKLYDYSYFEVYKSIISKIIIAEKKRKKQVLNIKSHIDKFNGKIIISGDFNSTQFSSIYKTLKDSKKDSFIEAGSCIGTTYRLFNYPLRLDYILVDISINVLSHKNFDLKLSDHEPILTELAIN